MVAIYLIGAAAGLAYVTRSYGATPWDGDFRVSGHRHGVPANLLKAIARKESSLNPSAVSLANANGTRDYGLMQLNSSNLSRFGISTRDALVPSVSIEAAARLLAEIRRELGSRFSSITWPMAYNVGSDLKPEAAATAYGAAVMQHWILYDLAGMFRVA